MLRKEQSIKEVLIEGAVKMTIKTFYDKGLFENYDNADEVLKDYSFAERRVSKEEVKCH